MTIFAILMTILVIYLSIRLHLYQEQARDLASQLLSRTQESNQRLTVFLRDRSVTHLCNAINRCIDAGQEAVLRSYEAQKQLKYTISCVSHDIRTPLTGAAGYIQMLEKAAESPKQKNYCKIVKQKLDDLENLLDELFLYTRLAGKELTVPCHDMQLFPALCDALTGFYESFAGCGAEPVIDFADEAVRVSADEAQLRRVLRNLIANALSHGQGDLTVRQRGDRLILSNTVKDPQSVRPEQMFERFYRDDISRRGAHAGLGLSISKELMELMNGTISAKLSGNVLSVTLQFASEKDQLGQKGDGARSE